MVVFIRAIESIAAFLVLRFCNCVFHYQYFLVILLNCFVLCFASNSHAQQTRIDSSNQQPEVLPLDLKLRIVWGGQKPVSYVGSIELENGTLFGTQQLGIDPNDPSFLLSDSKGRLTFDDQQTRFGGCDIRVQAKSNSRLILQLQIADPDTSKIITREFAWSLKSLRDNPDLQELGFNDCRLSIDRVPGDRLRVVTNRNHLVYNSEEPMDIQIQPYGLPWNSAPGNLDFSIVRLHDEQVVVRKSKTISLDERGHGESYDIPASAPKEEGVYEIRLKFEPKRILPGIIFRHLSIERVVQFVVYNNTPARSILNAHSSLEEDLASKWKPLVHIPLKSFENQSLTSLLAGQLASSKRFPLFDFAKSFSIMPKELSFDPSFGANETALQIEPSAIATTTITGLVPGEMHRLAMLSSNNNATYRVSISQIEPREQKSHEGLLANELFEVSSTRSIDRVVNPSTALGDEILEVLFWPNSRSAKLEITNLNATQTLQITKSAVDVWNESPKALTSQSLAPKNGCILELHSANLRISFGSEAIGNSEKKSPVYDDWRLFLRFAKQVGDYCRASGYETLAMTVHHEGGSLFPCSKLSSNARFDTGTFSSDGRDPLRKDILELMYRVMSRYGVEFVPMLELDSPIREIEEAIAKGVDKDLLQLRDSPRSIAGPFGNLYNPHSPIVQQAIAIALDEFETRYRSHPNYCGFALRATNASHLDVSVPIDQTNTAILDRFANAIGGNLPKDMTQREQFIVQRLQAAYSQWRKDSIAGFLERLKAKPKWVSIETESITESAGQSPAFISPILVGPPGSDLSQIHTAITGQWHLNSPHPIHIAMDKPIGRFDSSFARLARAAKPFQFNNTSSLPYRNNTRTHSKVRVWSSKEAGRSLLVSNAGAITESVHLAWDHLPSRYRLFSIQESDSADSITGLEVNLEAREWHFRIAASEVLRIDLEEEALPMYWYSQETETFQALDAALQSIEQAVSRLSIPQARVSTLSNPSFEGQNVAIRRGHLSGWTTSIDPNATVDIDSISANDGKSSIKIESNNSSSIAWIQSDPFALVQTERLFVSFQVAAEQAPQQVTISLSVFDPKTERFETIAVRDFANRIQRLKDPTNWSNVGVDLSNEFQLASQGNEAVLCRLQFEAKGKGRLWLDDVSLSTSFLRDGERRDLRSELFLAKASLQNGDSSPAVAMLNSSLGRLIQWSDTSVDNHKILVSTSTNKGMAISKSMGQDIQKSNALNNDANSPDTKQRPVKRLRNYLWPRKD